MHILKAPRPLPPEILRREIHGYGLRGTTLAEELGSGVVLLSFLRHFG